MKRQPESCPTGCVVTIVFRCQELVCLASAWSKPHSNIYDELGESIMIINRDQPDRHEVVTGHIDDHRETQGEKKSVLEENRHLKP